jgi:hypothetical protein
VHDLSLIEATYRHPKQKTRIEAGQVVIVALALAGSHPLNNRVVLCPCQVVNQLISSLRSGFIVANRYSRFLRLCGRLLEPSNCTV